MMRNLFTKLYLQFLGSFLIALLVIGLSVYGSARHALISYAQTRIAPVAQLAEETWQTLDADEQQGWLAIMSALSGTQWQSTELEDGDGYRIDDLHLTAYTVTTTLWLDEDFGVHIDISDWSDWEEVLGWLILNDLSNVDSELREARFQQLKLQVPFSISRVNREDEPLGALELRQLNNGQSVRINHVGENRSTLYFPAGAKQVIRLGPVDHFELLSTLQWILTILVSLLSLSLMFSLWVRPLHKRFMQLHRAVGRISNTVTSVKLPSQYDDQFGDLSSRIETLALNLIAQVDANKQLNLAVSHDLKTPLARIKFALALLEDAEENPYLVQISQDVSLLNELISELLLYHQLTDSKAYTGSCEGIAELTQRMERVPTSISSIQSLPERAIVPVASNDWRRIINNLVGNAEEFAHATIAVRLETTPVTLTLSIEDDGPGLSQEEFERLRLPFQRLSKHRDLDKAHHGLGLSLVDATVKHYGGTFTCVDGEMGGAKFIITLPYKSRTM